MTIVCAITDGRDTWIGSDRQVTIGGDLATPLREGKWQELPSGWWVGHSGWSRYSNLLLACVERSYDAAGLAARVRQLAEADGWTPAQTEEGPIQHNGALMLAKPGEVWVVLSCGTVLRHRDHELAAIGCGAACGLGAAYAVGGRAERGAQLDPQRRVHVAVAAACRYEPGCGHGVWTRMLEAS